MKKGNKESSLVAEGVLGFLSDTGKTELLGSVTDILEEAVEKTGKAEEITVTSQLALTGPELQKIAALVGRLLKKKLPIANKVDKNLLGGFTIRVGDFFLDASLSNDLVRLKRIILS